MQPTASLRLRPLPRDGAPRSPRGRAHVAALALLALTLAGACAAPRQDLGLIYQRSATNIGADRVPVIVLPGILGSRLEDPDGRQVWGAFVRGAVDVDVPSGARTVALPIDPGTPVGDLDDEVRATVVLDDLKFDLGLLRSLRVEAYAGILRSLAAGDYADATLGAAGEIDYGGQHYTCFQRAYDWRRDISSQARVLHDQILEAQRRAREARALAEDAPLRVDVVAHSMGGLLLRYYLRYGPEPLPEDGSLPELTWAGARNVRRAVLIGTPSLGSVLSLKQLIEGMDLSPFFPNYRPAVLGTMPSLYQLLPRARHARVLDGRSGQPVDLFDIEVWRRNRWGLLSPDCARTLEWLLPEVPESERYARAEAQLERLLDRARQFHAALDLEAAPPPGTELAVFVGDARRTVSLLEVQPDGDLRIAERAPGDGTVTRASALADEREGRTWTARLQGPVAWDRVQFLPAAHLGITTDRTFTDNLLWLLLEAP